MSLGRSSTAVISEEEADRLAESEFRDEARDICATMEITLQAARSGGQTPEAALVNFRREISNLRMRARSCHMPALNVLCHRLDDYAGTLKAVTPELANDLQAYLDRIHKLLDGEAIGTEQVPEVIRALPQKKTFDVSEVTVTEVELLLVMPQRSAARIVERELQACGYRVSVVLDAFEAIELAVRTKPDMIITGVMLGELSGVDLACAIAAMPTTKKIPIAVLTSLNPDSSELDLLPPRTGLIRRGPMFADDLAHVLQRFNIT
ncbi:MAG TPA: response regulator [Alphaproteobacteria bacterium]|nr:response regulator [Alphaproteobacteria bacterium]